MDIIIVERFRSPRFFRVYHVNREIPGLLGQEISLRIKNITGDIIVGWVDDYFAVHIPNQSKWSELEPKILDIIHQELNLQFPYIVRTGAMMMTKSLYDYKASRRRTIAGN